MNLRNELIKYIVSQSSSSSKQITAQKLFQVLENKFSDQKEQNVFSQQLFKTNLKKLSELILSCIFNQRLQFVKIDQLIPLVSILQHLLHHQSYDLPPSILKKTQTYVILMILMQQIDSVRNMFQDGRNSAIIANFYENIFKNAFKYRVKQLGAVFGLKIDNYELPLYLLQCIIEQKQGIFDYFDTKLTSQWIAITLIYFVIASKGDLYKQKAVLISILSRYHSLPYGHFYRQINGDELCQFYNNTVLRLIDKLEEKQIERLLDEIKTDLEVMNSFAVSPIQNENNTVLDNIIFSSSWQM